MVETTGIKERIIAAGIELAKDVGAGDVQVSDICERAGVSKGTFYNYFKSKDELFAQMYASMEPQILEELPAILLRDISPLRQFWLVFRSFIDRNMELGPAGVKRIAQSGFSEQGSHAFLYRSPKLESVCISLIKKCQDLKLVRTDCDAQTLLDHMVMLVAGASLQWSASAGAFDYAELLFKHFMLFLEAHPDFGAHDE